jgi:hypothetical protein
MEVMFMFGIYLLGFMVVFLACEFGLKVIKLIRR